MGMLAEFSLTVKTILLIVGVAAGASTATLTVDRYIFEERMTTEEVRGGLKDHIDDDFHGGTKSELQEVNKRLGALERNYTDLDRKYDKLYNRQEQMLCILMGGSGPDCVR